MPAQYILINITCTADLSDMLVAEMSGMGYDSFLLHDTGFQASILSPDFNKKRLDLLFRPYAGKAGYTTEELEDQNWNALWEKNFEPVIIGERCIVRASFHHPENHFPLDIVINPKMSFGTGHHETTRLMIEIQLETDHDNKYVLDVGCGTGILSILAEKLGAVSVLGIDIDDWAFENAQENIRENRCNKTEIRRSGIGSLGKKQKFDIILANINRQIIIHDMNRYSRHTVDHGLLICSGFLTEDRNLIHSEAGNFGFECRSERALNKWSAMVFQKKSD